MTRQMERKLYLSENIIFAVTCEDTAIHLHIEPDRSTGWVEIHRRPQPGQKPDDDNCWLLKGPCCHDGSTLYAEEVVIPAFRRCNEGDYKIIWDILEARIK